jgi:hypothetical protein
MITAGLMHSGNMEFKNRPEKNRPSQKNTRTQILLDTCLVFLARIKVSFEFS